MQLHSSIVPIALPISLVAGAIVFQIARHIPGISIAAALSFTQWTAGILNVAIGLPKNLLVADFVSAIFVRPLSLWGTVALLAHFFDSAT